MTRVFSSQTSREAALILLFCAVGLAALARPAHGQGSVTDSSVVYTLAGTSAYEVGCFGPCDCAVRSARFVGSFHLRRTGIDPLFTTYAVEDLTASILTPEGMVPVTGTGTYRIGGEVAVSHELQLDVVIGGDYAQAFDSGLVPGGGGFPAIDISAAAHKFACFDTVLQIAAKPASAAAPVGETDGPMLRASPNPFRGSTSLRMRTPVGTDADVRIVDALGRQVVHLSADASPATRLQAWTWDGHERDGTPARPGVYFGVVRASGNEWSQRLVKLE